MADPTALRAYRLDRGLSQAELASAARVSRQLVVAAETGVNVPGVDAAIRLAAALGATVEQLFGDVFASARRSPRAPAQSVRVTPGCLVVAGCDPALHLAETMLAGLGEASLLALDATTGTALEALSGGGVHAAVAHGPHASLPIPAAGVRRMQLAGWQVGIGLAPGLPERSLEDCLEHRLAIVQRPESAASQQGLRRAAAALGRSLPAGLVTSGHDDAASAAAALRCAAITTEGAAHGHGLRFIALEPHTVEIWFGAGVSHPGIDSLGDLLSGAAFKRSAASLGGYDLSGCGAWLSAAPV